MNDPRHIAALILVGIALVAIAAVKAFRRYWWHDLIRIPMKEHLMFRGEEFGTQESTLLIQCSRRFRFRFFIEWKDGNSLQISAERVAKEVTFDGAPLGQFLNLK
jgi:hypothetical protein